MREMPRYVEFAVASNFSFLRGASHAEELMLQAAHIGLDGLGLCDRNSVAGVVRAHLIKREKELALRYHPGARLVFADDTPDILAYPRDRAAWGRLCRLLTRGNLRAEKGECILYLDDLLEHIAGLELVVMETSTWELPSLPLLRKPPSAKAGSVRPAIDPGKIGRTAAASPVLPVPGDGDSKAKLRLVENERKPVTKPDQLLSLLRAAAPGRVRLAANMLYRGNDCARLARRAGIARQAGMPLIAVNDVLYHHPDRRELQDVLTCIREHLTIDRAGRRLAVNAERYLKPPAEMARLFRETDTGQSQRLHLRGFSIGHLTLHPREATALVETLLNLFPIGAEHLRELLRRVARVGQHRRVGPDRIDIDAGGEPRTTTVDDVATPRGDLHRPHILIFSERLELVLLLHLQIQRATERDAQQREEHHAHQDHANAHPLAGRLHRLHRLQVAHFTSPE
jgi:DNA polymerase III alpha subunit